jgi:O-antigen/teichoic acid export membrane protein
MAAEPSAPPVRGPNGAQKMIRNIAFIFGSNMASWGVSILFWLVVPRVIGPTAWGEYNLGVAISGLAITIGGLGIGTYLVKEVARDHQLAGKYIGTGMATNLALSLVIAAALVGFIELSRYSSHTKTVILLVAGISLTTFLVVPAFSAFQALEKMRLASIVYMGRQAIGSCVAIVLALLFKPDIVELIIWVLAANVIVSLLQVGLAVRFVGISLRFDAALSRRLISGGVPFWSNTVFLTFYIWIDSVLLSLLVSTQEVGYYAGPSQVIATLGFLPAIVTFAIFPALSSSFLGDFQRVRQLTRTSLSMLISLGLPMSIGVALVGPNVLRSVFGAAFAPSAPAMVVLAFTIVPAYIATLAYYVIAAVDRQRWWAYVMGSVSIINPLINLVLIPLFQHQFGHGSIGAAVALLITDAIVCVAGLALMPRDCLRPAGPILSVTMRTALATIAMAIPVWFLRDRFLLIPILVGMGVFIAAAFPLGIFRTDGYREAIDVLQSKLLRRSLRRPEINIPA